MYLTHIEMLSLLSLPSKEKKKMISFIFAFNGCAWLDHTNLLTMLGMQILHMLNNSAYVKLSFHLFYDNALSSTIPSSRINYVTNALKNSGAQILNNYPPLPLLSTTLTLSFYRFPRQISLDAGNFVFFHAKTPKVMPSSCPNFDTNHSFYETQFSFYHEVKCLTSYSVTSLNMTLVLWILQKN